MGYIDTLQECRFINQEVYPAIVADVAVSIVLEFAEL